MGRQPAWILGWLTQLAFTSACFPIRTFVHLFDSNDVRKAADRPFPNGRREGSRPQDCASWYSRVERAPERQNASSGCGRSASNWRKAATSSGDW